MGSGAESGWLARTLLDDGLVESIDIGGLDVFATILLEEVQPVADTAREMFRASSLSDVKRDPHLITDSRMGNSAIFQ